MHGSALDANDRQKPALAQTQQAPFGPEAWNKTMPMKSKSLNKLPPWYPRKPKAAVDRVDDLDQEIKPKTKQSGVIEDILKLVSSQDGGLRNLASSRKLLAYLQQKTLFNQRSEK